MGIPPTENLEYMYHRADIQFWAHCDLKWGSDGYLKKSKDRQRTTSDCKIEIVTRFDTDYFFLESFKKQ